MLIGTAQQPGGVQFLQHIYDKDTEIHDLMVKAGISRVNDEFDIPSFTNDYQDVDSETAQKIADIIEKKYTKK